MSAGTGSARVCGLRQGTAVDWTWWDLLVPSRAALCGLIVLSNGAGARSPAAYRMLGQDSALC